MTKRLRNWHWAITLPLSAPRTERLWCHLEIFLNFTRATGHPHPHLRAAVNNYVGVQAAMGRSREEILAALRELAPEFVQ